MVWRVEREDIRAGLIEQLAGAVGGGGKTAIVGPDGRGKTDLLLGVARRLGDEALLLRVPHGLDQAEAVVLQAAHGLGAEVLREVDATLRGDIAIEPALAVLDRHLNGRAILVDDIDSLAARPVDVDLHGVVRARTSAVEAWLGERAGLCTSSTQLGRIDFRARELEPLAAPPLRVSNGAPRDVAPLWEGVGRDPTRLALALTLAQLEGRLPERGTGRDEPLVEAVWAALPAAHRSVLLLLAVHGRPLPEEVLRAVDSAPSDPTIAAVRSLAAVGSDGGSLWVDGPLAARCLASLSEDDRRRIHLALAAAFAGELRGDEENVWLRAGWLLDAHRGFVAGGEPDRAFRFARYGVALLLDLGRERSLRREHSLAATIYERVLELRAPPMNARERAYAEHYLHYNRYKARPPLVEPLSQTEAGYRRSVEGWPGNALFWSRLSLTQFLAGNRGQGLATLAEARERVPDHVARAHTGKEWYLRSRTVQHLLRFDPPQIVEALLVFGDHAAADMREEEAERDLSDAISRGFQVALLESPGAPPVVLHRAVTVRIVPRGRELSCTLVELQLSARGPDRLAAFFAVVARLRSETARLLRALSHTLEPDTRARKQRLLGHVDVVASRLLGAVPESTWVLGQMVRGEGQSMRVRVLGSGAGVFDLDPSVVPPPLPEAEPRLARVRAGAAGEPIGPVLELGEPLGRDPDRLWAEWTRRLGETEPPRA